MANRVFQQCTLTGCTLQCLAELLRIDIGHVVRTCLAFSLHANGCQDMCEERSLPQSGPCQNSHAARELASLCRSLVRNVEPLRHCVKYAKANTCDYQLLYSKLNGVRLSCDRHCERHVSERSLSVCMLGLHCQTRTSHTTSVLPHRCIHAPYTDIY